MINWQFFPKSIEIPEHLKKVVLVFEKNIDHISSDEYKHSSNAILNRVRIDLEAIGFLVEKTKKEMRR